ncbi:MAG: AMP-binding protein [Aquihabitans sp.]
MTATSTAWARHLEPGVTVTADGLVTDGSLCRRWARIWRGDGGRRVLHSDATGWLSASEFDHRTATVAARFAGIGVRPGDRVLLSAEPSVDLVVAYVAALRAGAVVLPVNTGYRERELGHVVTDGRPQVAVVDREDRAQWVRTAGGPTTLVVGPDVDLPDGQSGEIDQAQAEDPALLLYTSGTTGVPKGALLSHGNLLASAEAVRLAWRWTPDDRLVLALPLFHLHGLGVGLNGSLAAGASIVLRTRFDAADVVGAIADRQASQFFGVPTMYARLASGHHLDGLRPLRLCVSGSAPLPADLHRTVADQSGQHVIERYGMTETVMNVSNPYVGERRPGTVGFPLPGVEVRLAEPTGEILLRGPNVFGGYWNRPEETAASFADGWFRSGDVGAFDRDGYLRIIGRTKELIISGGYNVYPREVEDVVRKHPGVEDVAVVGVEDPDWGEVVVAFYEGDAEPGELQDLARSMLAAYKAPKRLHRVEALPRNALGKVVKGDLHEP